MTPRHHPSDEVLASYAAGALESGFGLVAGVHVDACAQCRAKVRSYEAASGASMIDLPEAELSAGALQQVMARLGEVAAPAAVDKRPLLDRLPLRPRRWVAPGVWVAAVDTPHARDNRVYVLSVKPGMPTARHRHSGAEFCTVLRGAYRDEVGLFQVGDFAAAEHDLEHLPVVQPGEECVCLFATEGRLKPRGLMGRIAFALADV